MEEASFLNWEILQTTTWLRLEFFHCVARAPLQMIEAPNVFPGVECSINGNFFCGQLLKCIKKTSLTYTSLEAKTLADRQHRQVQEGRLVREAPSSVAAGSTAPAAKASPFRRPNGASPPGCGCPATPSRRGARRKSRNWSLCLFQRLQLFVLWGSFQAGGQQLMMQPVLKSWLCSQEDSRLDSYCVNLDTH